MKEFESLPDPRYGIREVFDGGIVLGFMVKTCGCPKQSIKAEFAFHNFDK